MKTLRLVVLCLTLAWGLASGSSARAAATCAFGEDLDALFKNSRFKVTRGVVKTFKLSRLKHDDRLLLVEVALVEDKKTKRSYHLNLTFRSYEDGDNPFGWIEEVTDAAQSNDGAPREGEIAAIVLDYSIEECTVR